MRRHSGLRSVFILKALAGGSHELDEHKITMFLTCVR